MTVRARLGRTFVTAALAIVATATAVHAQPGKKPPVAEPAPPPPPGPDPETQAKLDAQAAAIAASAEQLAAQQKQLDDLTSRIGRVAELAKALDDERAASAALAAKLDADRSAHASDLAKLAKPAEVVLSGYLQVDGAWRQAAHDELKQSGDPLNEDRFSLRRARPRITATYGAVQGIAEIDVNTVNGGQVRPSAFEAAYQIAPWLRAGLGFAKIPFGFEVEQSDKDRLFLERTATERALFPGEYDGGIKLSGAWKFLRYGLAAQNGEPVGEKGFALRDPNRAKDYSWRVGVETHAGDVTLAGGFSYLTGRGFHNGTPATKDVLVWRDLNEDGTVNAGEIQVVAGQAATPSASFDRYALGADAEVTIDLHERGKLMVYGEIVAAANLDRGIQLADPVATGRDARELGWYVAAVHEPTTWSSLGVRYDHYNPDADASELRTGNVVPVDPSLSTLAVTGALRHPHGRLILQYDHNRNHSGRTTSGVPTNLGDDALTLRGEVKW